MHYWRICYTDQHCWMLCRCYYTISHVRYCVVEYCIQWSVTQQSHCEASIQWGWDSHSKKKQTILEWITENWELSPVDSTSAGIPMHTGYSAKHLTHLAMLASLLLVWVWTRKQFSNWHDSYLVTHLRTDWFKSQVGTNLTGLYTSSRKVSWLTSLDVYSPRTYHWQKHVKDNHHNPWLTAIPNCLTKGQLQKWSYGCWVG